MDKFFDAASMRFWIRDNGTVFEVCTCRISCRCVPKLIVDREKALVLEVMRLQKEVEMLQDMAARRPIERDQDERKEFYLEEPGVVRRPTTIGALMEKIGPPQFHETSREGFDVPAAPELSLSEEANHSAVNDPRFPQCVYLTPKSLGKGALSEGLERDFPGNP